MRVFVTGASGWIGSATVDELLGAGHEVVGLARSDDSAAKIEAAGAEVRRGDLDDLDGLKAAASESDGVIHLAFAPEHLREWWPDEAHYTPAPGAPGSIAFGDTVVGFDVVEARPPSTFSFRWTQPTGEPARPDNSYLVTIVSLKLTC